MDVANVHEVSIWTLRDAPRETGAMYGFFSRYQLLRFRSNKETKGIALKPSKQGSAHAKRELLEKSSS